VNGSAPARRQGPFERGGIFNSSYRLICDVSAKKRGFFFFLEGYNSGTYATADVRPIIKTIKTNTYEVWQLNNRFGAALPGNSERAATCLNTTSVPIDASPNLSSIGTVVRRPVSP